jgi:hypothetical protein
LRIYLIIISQNNIIMKITLRIVYAIAIVACFTIAAGAQRQEKLYIDNGSGTFTTLSTAGNGGSIIVPASGTLLTGGNSNTITSLGTISTGTWRAGIIGPAYGGTGINTSSTVIGSLLYTNGTGTWTTLDPGTSTYVLTSNGTGFAPSWQAAAGGGGSGVNLQGSSPGTQQTGNINVSGTIIAATAIQADHINPNATGGTTFGGVVSLASNNLLNVAQLSSHSTTAPTGSGTTHLSSVTLAAHSTDMAGEVTFTANTGVTGGDAAIVTFASAYSSYNTTIVVLTPADDATATAFAGVGYYVNPSKIEFEVVLTAPIATGTYSFYYHVIAE